MNAFRHPACILSIFLVLLSGLRAAAVGLEFVHTETFQIGADETYADELWLVAGRVRIDGSAAEDLFIACDEVELPGRFQKDVWALARNVTLSGQVDDSARFIAQNVVQVDGRIGSSFLALADTVSVNRGAVIERDMAVMAGDVILRGHLKGRAWIQARSATLGGVVDGTVRVQAEDIVVLPGTRIGGDLVYTSPRELVLDRNVVLDGHLIRREHVPVAGPWSRPSLLMQLMLYIAALIAGIPFVAVFSSYSGRAVRLLRHAAWKCLLMGGIALFLMPMLALFAGFTLIGLPLAALLGGAYLILLYLSKIVVGLALGSLLLARRGPQPFASVLSSLVIGLLLLYFLAYLPMVGYIVTIGICFLGFGGLILGLFTTDGGRRPPMPASPEAGGRRESFDR